MGHGSAADHSPEVVALICARMAEGESLRSVCRSDEMPALSTVFRWLGEHQEFQEQYARARQARASAMEEEILSISDDDSQDRIVDAQRGRRRSMPNSSRALGSRSIPASG